MSHNEQNVLYYKMKTPVGLKRCKTSSKFLEVVRADETKASGGCVSVFENDDVTKNYVG